jgi:hypothetical protein
MKYLMHWPITIASKAFVATSASHEGIAVGVVEIPVMFLLSKSSVRDNAVPRPVPGNGEKFTSSSTVTSF